MLVMLAVIILAVWAWFAGNPEAEAGGISVASKAPNEISLAECIKTYDSEGTLVKEGPGEFTSDLSFNGPYTLAKDCTGDGMNLIVPDFSVIKDKNEAKTTGKIVNLNGSCSNAVSQLESEREHELNPDKDAPEYQYIKHEFYLRSSNETFTLAPESILLSETEKNGTSLSVAPSEEKKSAYGNFNVDALVGAMRVAIIAQPANTINQQWENDPDDVTKMRVRTDAENAPTCTRGTEERQLMWVPRPDIYLDVYPDNENNWDAWTINTGITGSSTTENSNHKRISEITYKHEYYKNENSEISLVTDNGASTSTGSFNSVGAMPLGHDVTIGNMSDGNKALAQTMRKTSLRDDASTDSYYVYKITLKVWIEGTDSEARRAMDGGQFRLNMKFGL